MDGPTGFDSEIAPRPHFNTLLHSVRQMGAPLHDLDAAGQTALHYAVSNYGQASAEITEFLVAAGCDVNAR